MSDVDLCGTGSDLALGLDRAWEMLSVALNDPLAERQETEGGEDGERLVEDRPEAHAAR